MAVIGSNGVIGGGAPLSGGGGGGLFGLGDAGTGALISGLFGLGGGILQGIGQGQMNEAQLAQARELALRQEALQQQQLGQARDIQGLQASQLDPLAQQRMRQQNAMMAALAGNARNATISSQIPGMNRYIPQISGGLRLPEGGFGQDVMGMFTPEARAQGEAQFHRAAAPFVPPPDLSKVGYGEAGAGATDPAMAAYTSGQKTASDRNAALMAALQAAQGKSATAAAQKPSKAKKTVGALAGAGTGAATGFAMGGPVGAAIGGIGGFLKGLF